MELREGYKQTEVGVIPEDWEVVKFGDCVNYIKGYPFKSSDYAENGVRVIRVSDTTSDSIENDNAVFVSERSANTYKKWCLRKNDLIFSTVGSKPPMFNSLVGKAIIVSSEYDGSLLNQNAVAIRSKSYSEFFQKLLLNHFRTDRYIQYIELIFRGNANQASITLVDLFKYKIPLPPTKTEQAAIANALSDADALIQSLTGLIVKKRQIKQGAMQTLLNPYENGSLKKGWEKKKLGDVTDILTGFPFPSASYATEGVRLLRGSNIKRGKTNWKEEITKYWPAMTFDINKYELNEGDIVVAMDGSLVGRSFAQLQKKDLPAVLLQRVARIRTKSNLFSIDYIKEWVCSKLFTEHCDALKTVTAIPHISPADIFNFELNIPERKIEQIKIADILSNMDTEITTIETKLTKAKKIKQGMMQNFLTGKIRLI